MKYLTGEEVLVLHARIIEETGGLDGVRDTGLLISACMRPASTFDGKKLYPTVFEQAAALLESLARNHVFLDGNKRTAFVAAALFMHKNGYEMLASNKATVSFMLEVAVGKADLAKIAEWLKKHTKKVKI